MRWESVAGVTYFLERSTNLVAWPRFRLVATNLLGQAGMTTYTDTSATGLTPLFYRVGVESYIAPTNPPQPARESIAGRRNVTDSTWPNPVAGR